MLHLLPWQIDFHNGLKGLVWVLNSWTALPFEPSVWEELPPTFQAHGPGLGLRHSFTSLHFLPTPSFIPHLWGLICMYVDNVGQSLTVPHVQPCSCPSHLEVHTPTRLLSHKGQPQQRACWCWKQAWVHLDEEFWCPRYLKDDMEEARTLRVHLFLWPRGKNILRREPKGVFKAWSSGDGPLLIGSKKNVVFNNWYTMN